MTQPTPETPTPDVTIVDVLRELVARHSWFEEADARAAAAAIERDGAALLRLLDYVAGDPSVIAAAAGVLSAVVDDPSPAPVELLPGQAEAEAAREPLAPVDPLPGEPGYVPPADVAPATDVAPAPIAGTEPAPVELVPGDATVAAPTGDPAPAVAFTEPEPVDVVPAPTAEGATA